MLPNTHNVIQAFLVVDFSFIKGALLNFDFFIEERELFIPLNELCAEDVSFIDDHFVVLLLFLLFGLGLADDILEASNVALLRFNHFFRAFNISFNFFFVLL